MASSDTHGLLKRTPPTYESFSNQSPVVARSSYVKDEDDRTPHIESPENRMDEQEHDAPLPDLHDPSKTSISNSKMRITMATMIFFGLMIVYILRVNLSMAIIPMSEYYNWSDDYEGVFLSSFFWGYTITNLPGGYLATRIGGKWVFGIGVAGSSLFTAALPFCSYFFEDPKVLFIVSRVFTGFCEGVTFPTVHNLISRWYGDHEKSSYLAVVWTGSVIGTVVPLAGSASIINSIGWKFIFFISAALGGVWFVIWIIFSSSSPEESKFISRAEFLAIKDTQMLSTKAPRGTPWLLFFTSKPVWAIIIATFCNIWTFYTLLNWMPTYLADQLHFQLGSSGIIAVLPYLFSGASQLFAGRLADYLLVRGMNKTILRKLFTSIALLFASISLGLLCLNPAPVTCVVLLIACQAVGSFTVGGYAVNQIDLSPQYAGIIFGMSNTAGSIAGILATSLVGAILQATNNSWRLVFALASFIQFFGMIIYVIFGSAKPLNIPQHYISVSDTAIN